MNSPFPGLDPYLEMHWRDVHTALMVYSRDAIQEQLPSDLAARVEESVAIDENNDEPRSVVPDVSVTEEIAVFKQEDGVGIGTVVAVAEPLIVAAEHTERRIEIIDVSSKGRVVTVIGILSLSNRLPGADRSRYIAKQQDYVRSGTNLVEIDFVRSGDFVVAVSTANLTSEYLESPIACVRRAVTRADAEVYRMPIREKLPTIRIPLRPSDNDVILNLQELMSLCYRRGRFSSRIDYTADPKPPLSGVDSQWADELLRTASLRN